MFGTCFAIAKAISEGTPLIEDRNNYRRRCGYASERLGGDRHSYFEYVDTRARKSERGEKVVMGGPMMGFAVQSSVPVVKTTNCILVPGIDELNSGENARECIRCSACADACPVQLLPQQLYWHSKAQEWENAALRFI